MAKTDFTARTDPDLVTLPLGFLLRQAAGAHRLKLERSLLELKITPPQFLILTVVSTHSGCSNADVARLTSLSTPTITVIVTNLKRMDALNSTPHVDNKRIQQLSLTEKGKVLLWQGRKCASILEAELSANLSAVEIKLISQWLEKAAS